MPLNKLWVQLKENDEFKHSYRIFVPSEYLSYVFDPHGELRDEYSSYRDCIVDSIELLGTAALDAYIEQISKLNEEENLDVCNWVITSLDHVDEDTDGVTLKGRVEPFEGNQFEFVKL